MGNTITAEAARKITGKHWMTRREAAKYLGLAEQTLANSRAKGPKYYKFLSTVRYLLKDLDMWASQRVVVR